MPPLFPRTSKLILDAFKELEDTERTRNPKKRPAVVARIALDSKLSPASLVAWRSGKNAPTQRKAEVLAVHLFPQSRERRRQFVEAIAQERTGVKLALAPRIDPLDLLEQHEEVEIKLVNSPPFASSSGTGFFDRLIRRYIAFTSVGTLKQRTVPFHEVSKEILVDQPPPAVAGILATVDRMRTFSFITTPVRIRVAAVIRRPHSGDPTKQGIRDALESAATQGRALVEAPAGNRAGKQLPIRALIARGEVGGLFAEKALNLPASQVTYVDRGNLAGYLSELEKPDPHAISVAMLDEHTAGLLVLEGRSRAGSSNRSTLDFVFDPLEPSPLPSYFLAFGADRRHARWCQYFAESIGVYLEADAPYVIKIYEDLWKDLNVHQSQVLAALGKLPAQREAMTNRWARQTMGLPDREDRRGDNISHPSLAWRTVIQQLHTKLRPDFP